MQELSVTELKEALDNDELLLIDVREPWEYQLVHIEQSLNLPLGQLPQLIADLEPSQPIALLCHHGMRSAQALAWLSQQGFEQLYNVQGGIDAWAREVDTSLATY